MPRLSSPIDKIRWNLVFCILTVALLFGTLVSITAPWPNSGYASALTSDSNEKYSYSPYMNFTGTNYLDISNPTTLKLSKFSLAGWFKTSVNYSTNAMIVNRGGLGSELAGQNMNYGIWLTSEEKLKAGFETAAGTDSYLTYTTGSYNDGRWHYVVSSYDGLALRLYVDGVQIAWRPLTATPDNTGNQPMRVGANSRATNNFFNGQIDEVRVWNRAISATEVSDQYNKGLFNENGILVHVDGSASSLPADSTPPQIIVQPDKLVEASGDLTQVDLGFPIVTDLEDANPAVTNDSPPDGFSIGTTAVSWKATDSEGNSATATQFVTVLNDTDPSLSYTFCSSGCNFNNLQTAINSLPASGGRIIIKDGTYVIFNTISLKSNTVLDFSNSSSIYFRGDSKPLFKGYGVSNVKINGGKLTAELSGVKLFSFTSSRDIMVTDTRLAAIQGGSSNAFYCVDCTNVFITRIDATSATRLVDIKSSSGITDGKSSSIWIKDGKFDGSSIEGVKVNHSTNVHIINNTITNTAENGIDIGWNKNSEVADNRLINTGYPNGAAIHTDSANGADILNNYVDTTGKTAIPIYRASNINVIGNIIIHAGDQGISIISKLEPSSYAIVRSNHIISPVGYGIYESPSQYQVEIANNLIEDVPTGMQGIYVVWSNNETTKVYDNTIM